MSLTIGSGPLGPKPAGRFSPSIDVPSHLLYAEPYFPRVRAILAGETLVDSTATILLHETGRLPVFWFPPAALHGDLALPAERHDDVPALGVIGFHDVRVAERLEPGAVRVLERPADGGPLPPTFVSLDWDAVDEWFVEDEQLFGHPRDPYSRIDVWKTTRHVRVLLDEVVLADTRRARILVETALPPRFYVPPEDVRTDLLLPSPHRSRCAYKGSASYWHVRVSDRLEEDLVWTYATPQHDAEPVRDMLCFFNERVDIELDDEIRERPTTQWSRQQSSPGGGRSLTGLMRLRR